MTTLLCGSILDEMSEMNVNSISTTEAPRQGVGSDRHARRRFTLQPVPTAPAFPVVIDEAPWLPPVFDEQRVTSAVREILAAIGEDPDRDGLKDTPARVARAYREIFAGIRQDAAEHLCMKMRGARSGQSSMTTFAHRGACAQDVHVRQEALAALGRFGSYGTAAGAP